MDQKPDAGSKRILFLAYPLITVFLFLLIGTDPPATITVTYPTPTTAPHDTIDLSDVQQLVTDRINAERASQALPPIAWDDVLADYASIRTWQIVRGEIPFDYIDDSLTEELREPVAALIVAFIAARHQRPEWATLPQGSCLHYHLTNYERLSRS